MRLKTIALMGLCLWPLLSTTAMAERIPRPVAADERVKTLTYHENDVYRLQGHYGFTTTIKFSERESIETISIGDSESWQITKPSRPNVLFVKPLEPNAQTNMTVLTTKRVYTFEMAASNADSPKSSDLTFRLKFLYPETTSFELANFSGIEGGTDPLITGPVSDWNFDYSYSGTRSLRPERVFDDGTFTYFQFRDMAVMPAVFSVDEQGNESLVNFIIQGRYLVVSGIRRQFTLRDGDTSTCIFNERYPEVTGTQIEASALGEIEEQAHAGIPIPSRKPDIELAQAEDSDSFFGFFNGLQPVSAAKLNH